MQVEWFNEQWREGVKPHVNSVSLPLGLLGICGSSSVGVVVQMGTHGLYVVDPAQGMESKVVPKIAMEVT